jgi:hypothetical protein
MALKWKGKIKSGDIIEVAPPMPPPIPAIVIFAEKIENVTVNIDGNPWEKSENGVKPGTYQVKYSNSKTNVVIALTDYNEHEAEIWAT